MENPELNVVTGAFSYTGRYITRRLLAMGKEVRTLTGHPSRGDVFEGRVAAYPFNFDKSDELRESMRGATTLYNTYWIRFPYGSDTHDRAIENTQALIKAAEDAGVERIVHISVTNCSENSSLSYYRGKAVVEKVIMQSRIPYSIIRPTLIFGVEDILINNIAWLLRVFPTFVIPGRGEYRLQPIFAEDMAEIAVSAAAQHPNAIIDAAGPDIYTFDALVRLIARKIDSRARIVHLPPSLALLFSQFISRAQRDTILTRDELEGLMASLLVSSRSPLGTTRLGDWLDQNVGIIGRSYAHELKRHYK